MKKVLCCSLIPVLLFLVIGCSSTTPPDQVVKSFLDAMVKGEFEKAAEFVVGEGEEKDIVKTPEDKEGERLAKAILAKVTYELGEKKIDGDNATVAAKITAPDLLRITSKAISELLPMAFAMAFSEDNSEDQMDAMFQQYFENAISDPNAPMAVSDVQVSLEKKDGAWLITPDDALSSALTGNMEKAFAGLEDK